MIRKNDEILGAGGRGGAGGGGSDAPYGFMPESYYDWSGQTDYTTTLTALLHGTSWGDGEYGVGEGGRKLIAIACDGTLTVETAPNYTSNPTTDVQMSLTNLKPGYSYFVRGYAQNQRGWAYYSPITRPAWTTNGNGSVADNMYAAYAAITKVGKDNITVTVTGGSTNRGVYCKIYYTDITNFNATTLSFNATSQQRVLGTDSITFTITGLTAGHDYSVALQKTYAGVTTLDAPKFVRLPSITTDTNTQKVTDTGWQTVSEQAVFTEQRKNTITATRTNNTVTLSVQEGYRHAAFPARYNGRDFNITGEDVYSRSFDPYSGTTTLKSSSIYNTGTEQTWLTLGTFNAGDTLATAIYANRTPFNINVTKDTVELNTSLGWDESDYGMWTDSIMGGNPIYFPIPAAGSPTGISVTGGSATPNSQGSANTVTVSGSSWGANCTGGSYAISGDGISAATQGSATSTPSATAVSFSTTATNKSYSLTPTLSNDAGQSASGTAVNFYTPPAAPTVELATNTGGTASFTFTKASSDSALTEAYYWRLSPSDSWHPASESASDLTSGTEYTVQVKATTTPASGYGGGDSLVVNGLTFIAGGEIPVAEPHVWVKNGSGNDRVGHFFVNVNGVKKRLSKIYVKTPSGNKLIFRDYFGAHDTVDAPTIITLESQLASSEHPITLKFTQDVANGVFVDWGDGSNVVTSSTVGEVTLTHTYPYANTPYDLMMTPLKSCKFAITSLSEKDS